MDLTFAIKAVDKASGVVDKVGGKLSGLKGKLGPVFKALALGAAGAAVAIGVALFKIGSDFEAAFNIIAVGTGASGEALAGLKDDFKTVFKSIPVDMEAAASAVADFNTLTGFTGENLQGLAIRGLEAARMLGEDASALIENSGRAFNVFNLGAEESQAALDEMFVVSQNTGLGMTKLAGNIQTFGPIMRNAGFSIQDTALLFGDLHKAGVDVSRVMPALNSFTRKLAAEGITDLSGAVKDQIEAIRDATTTTEALNMATEAFGAEGAQRMTTAIRAGGLSLDELQKSLDGSWGAINRNAEATQTLGDRFTILKNRAMVAIEPLATGFLTALQDLADLIMNDVIPPVSIFVTQLKEDLTPTVKEIARVFFQDVAPALAQVFGFLLEHKAEVKGALVALGIAVAAIVVPAFIAWAVAAGTAAVATLAAAAPFVAIGFAIAALGAAFVILNEKTGFFTDGILPALTAAFNAIVSVLQGQVLPVLKKVGEFLLEHKPIIIGLVAVIVLLVAPWMAVIAVIVLVLAKWDEIKEMLTQTIPEAIDDVIEKVEGIPVIGEIFEGALNAVVLIVTTQFEIIKNIVETTIEAIINIVQFWIAIFKGDWDEAWNEAKELVSGIWDGIFEHVKLVLGLIVGLIWEQLNVIVGVIGDAIPLLLQVGKDLIQGLFNGVKNHWDTILLVFFLGLPAAIILALGALLPLLKPLGEDILRGLRDGIIAIWTELVKPMFERMPGAIITAIGNVADLLYDIGKAIMESLLGGLKAAWEGVKNFVGGIAGAIKSLKGPLQEDAVLLIDEGKAIMQGLGQGLKQGFEDDVRATLEEAGRTIEQAFERQSIAETLKEAGKTTAQTYAKGIEQGSAIAERAAENFARNITRAIDELLIADAAGLVDNFSERISELLRLAATQVKAPAASIGEGIGDGIMDGWKSTHDAVSEMLKLDAMGLVDDFMEAWREAAGLATLTMPGGGTFGPDDFVVTGGGPDGPGLPGGGAGGGGVTAKHILATLLAPGEITALTKALGGSFDAMKNMPIGEAVRSVNTLGANKFLSMMDQWIGTGNSNFVLSSLLDDLRRFGLSFHSGGIVPGPIGMPVQATLLGGEQVLTRAQQRGVGGITINGPLIQHTGPLMGDAIEARNFARLVGDELLRVKRGA